MATSELFVHYWPLMLCIGVIGFIGTRLYLNSERGSYGYDKWKLRVPIIGSIIHRATLARLCRALAMSLAAGLPVTQALTISAKAAGNQRISEHVFSLRNAVERGESLSRAAVVTGLFTPLILQMLQTGEETGLVDDMLAEVASFYEQEVDYEVKNLATNIEPLLIAFIAVAVLILALGVFLPMWDLATISRKS
jgi:MSHA biogenesis protein MshG